MVDLDAMDADPWPTWPVDKNELRGLVDEIERLRAANGYRCSRVDYLPYCHEIERLRAALLKISELEPEGPLGNDCMAVSYASETARAALEGEASHD